MYPRPQQAAQKLEATNAAASKVGQITQPSTKRAHRVHPANMSTAVPVAAAQCPTARAMLRISG